MGADRPDGFPALFALPAQHDFRIDLANYPLGLTRFRPLARVVFQSESIAMTNTVELHLVCGKVAAGKSTLCARLASEGAFRIEQDRLMSTLYPEMETVADYLRHVPRLRDAITPIVVELLVRGVSVVLDWPANTVATRAWMRGLAEQAAATARLHWLETSDAICLDRLAQRNSEGTHDYTVSADEFAELSAWFEPPTDAEGFEIIRHPPG